MCRQMASLLYMLALASSASAAGESKRESPVQRVIVLLENLKAKVLTAKQEEEQSFSIFKVQCDDGKNEFARQIESAVAEIASLESQLELNQLAIKTLDTELSKLDADTLKWAKQKALLEQDREHGHALYIQEITGIGGAIDSVSRAIMWMESQKDPTPALRLDSAVFLQIATSSLKEDTKQKVTSLLSMFSSQEDMGAPEAYAYEFQSGEILETLEKLKIDCQNEYDDRQKQEAFFKSSFDLQIQDFNNMAEKADRMHKQKTAEKAQKARQVVQNKSMIQQTQEGKKADEDALAALEKTCMESMTSFRTKQALRQEEAEAIAEAIGILSGKPAQFWNQHYVSAVQEETIATALLQIGSKATASGVHVEITKMLLEAGKRQGSKELSALAAEISRVPQFNEVKRMIVDMISRLQKQMSEETTHRARCDKELTINARTRFTLKEEVEGLMARYEDGEVMAIQLTNSVKKLTEDMAAMNDEIELATEEREKESFHNADTVKDAEEGLQAVGAAVKVLRKFYEDAQKATAFVQLQQDPAMRHTIAAKPIPIGSARWNMLLDPNGLPDHLPTEETYGATYNGMQGDADGVLVVMDVIKCDFETLLSETKSEEEQSLRAYEDLINKINVALKVSEKTVKLQRSQLEDVLKKNEQDSSNLKFTQDQLRAAEDYNAKLTTQCTDQGVTWEERKKGIEDEIETLRMCIQILSASSE